MQITVTGENKFKAQKNQFMVGQTEGGYTLQYSADGENWTDYPEDIPASEDLIVNGAMQYGWYRLSGNEGEVKIIL